MELRKDYILDRYVIISQNRGKRPFDIAGHSTSASPLEQPKKTDPSCVFCQGNESLTPPEIGHIGEPWKIRWTDNKFAALAPEGKFDIKTDNKYFTYSDAYGYHEVIVETNDHSKQMSDLKDFELLELFKTYKTIINDLNTKAHIKYVMIFKNHGPAAGTSLKHSHTQVVAFNHLPLAVTKKLDAVTKYDTCPYCEIIEIEKGSLRRCYENKAFVAFTPYASRFNYEVWIFPKKHYASITDVDDAELLDLAQILHSIVVKLKGMDASFNFAIHNTPKNYSGKALHFHIEVMPRMQIWAGAENGSEVIINNVSPEDAAKYYRE